MAKIHKEWTEFKTLVSNKVLPMQYYEDSKFYRIFAQENGTTYACDIYKESDPAPVDSDQEDFEDNFKDDINLPVHPSTPDFKTKVVASSRPENTYTYFTSRGDDTSGNGVGDGKKMTWDFSNTTDDIASPPTGFKVKELIIEFNDPIWIKEGTLYFHDAIKGSFVDFYIVCRDDEYYVNNAGVLTQADGDTKIQHYIVEHPMCGSVPMGDELNTESAVEQAVPTSYFFCIEITVPDTDSSSHGTIEFEAYRTRTMDL